MGLLTGNNGMVLRVIRCGTSNEIILNDLEIDLQGQIMT